MLTKWGAKTPAEDTKEKQTQAVVKLYLCSSELASAITLVWSSAERLR
jgi:hypothetical protein